VRTGNSVVRRGLVFGVAFLAAMAVYRVMIPQPAAYGDAAGKVELKILGWDDTQKLIASKKGQVVVLDAWSTSCVPCMREFPHLVELHKALGDDVACISLSADYTGSKTKPPEFYREKVLKFLTKQGATFDNVLSSLPSDELFETLDIPSIPAVFVYDRSGKLLKKFDNSEAESEEDEFTYKDVRALVEKEVGKEVKSKK
jgi:thiol-disulfide isomerase/thioredoxin